MRKVLVCQLKSTNVKHIDSVELVRGLKIFFYIGTSHGESRRYLLFLQPIEKGSWFATIWFLS